MSDKVTVDISPIANSVTVAPITTSVEIINNTTSVELTSVTYENNITQSVTNVNITPSTTTVEATVNTTTIDISPNTTTVGVGDASIVSSNLASATNTSHASGSWITGGNVQVSFDNLATTADSRYVNVTGDTMTGNLTVPALKVEKDNGTAYITLHDSTDDDDHIIYLTGIVDNSTQNIFSLGTNSQSNQFQMHSYLNRDFEFTFGNSREVDPVATISTSGLDVAGTITATSFIGNVTGQVSDLSNHTFFSGSYDDLDDKPTLFDGAYNSLSGKPTLFSGSYNDLDAKPTLVTSIDGLSDVDITTTAPTDNQVLVWSTNKFVPADQSASGVDLTAFSVGSNASASGSGGLGYNNTSGVFTYTPPNLTSYLTSETTTSLALESNVLKYTDETGTENEIDISLYLDDTNLARLTSGTLEASSGTATFTRSDNTTFTVDFSSLINSAEVNNLSTSVTWANVPNANITESSVTQHQAALSITESQISNLGNYLTSETSHTDVLVDGDFTSNGLMKRTGEGQYTIDSSTYITDYTVTESDVTDHQAALSIEESQISNFGTYLTSETDPVVGAITGIVKADGSGTISAAVAGTDYSTLAIGTTATTALAGNSAIGALSDVSTNSILSGNVLFYDSVNSTFKPSIAGNGGVIAAQGMKSYISSQQHGVFSAGQSSGGTPHTVLNIGSEVTGANNFSEIRMQPGINGLRVHYASEFESDGDANNDETLRLHTTNRGIHVGDNRIGTYTAGDLQSNADTDFGMLVGRESTNTGSNNFGFGFKHTFGTNTSSNLATGSSHQCNVSGSTNNFFGGGDNRLETSGDNNFCGGTRTSTRNDLNFSWGEGVVDGNNRYSANNYGHNCVLFGKQTSIDTLSKYSLIGGDNHPTTFNLTKIRSGRRVINWGLANDIAFSNDSITVGNQNNIDFVDNSAIFGSLNTVTGTSTSNRTFGLLVAGDSHDINEETDYSLVAGKNHIVEGKGNFAVGINNNSIGEAGACIGKGLKTPLFEPNAGGDYVWDDYSIVVGGFNDEAHKYYTNTNSSAWVTDHRFVVGTGTASNAKDNGFIVSVATSGFSGIIMPKLASSPSYTNDLNARAGGVPVGGLYHNNGVVKIVLDS